MARIENCLHARRRQGVDDALMTVRTPRGQVPTWGRFCSVNVGVCYNTSMYSAMSERQKGPGSFSQGSAQAAIKNLG